MKTKTRILSTLYHTVLFNQVPYSILNITWYLYPIPKCVNSINWSMQRCKCPINNRFYYTVKNARITLIELMFRATRIQWEKLGCQ